MSANAVSVELSELRQAVWEARAILGFDNDGDPTPDAMSFPTLAELVKRDAAEARKDYDAACDEAARFRKALEDIKRHCELVSPEMASYSATFRIASQALKPQP